MKPTHLKFSILIFLFLPFLVRAQCTDKLRIQVITIAEIFEDYPDIVENPAEFEQKFSAHLNLANLALGGAGVELYVENFIHLQDPPSLNYLNDLEGLAVIYRSGGSATCGTGSLNGLNSRVNLPIQTLQNQADDAESFIHEVGHCLSLLHTFGHNNSSHPRELVVRPGDEEPGDLFANCSYTGDYLCGTAGVPISNVCWQGAALDLNGDSYYLAEADNFMSYSQCATLVFKQAQLDQMRGFIQKHGRSFGWINSGEPYAYQANFESQIITPLASEEDEIEVLFQFTGNLPIGFEVEWDFGDGSPYSSDLNPSHVYPSRGHYTVTLTVKNPSLATACNVYKNEVNLLHLIPVSSHYKFENTADLDYFKLESGAATNVDAKRSYFEGNYGLGMFFRPMFSSTTDYFHQIDCYIDARFNCNLFLDFFYRGFSYDSTFSLCDTLKVYANGVYMDKFTLPEINTAQIETLNLSQFAGEIVHIEFRLNKTYAVGDSRKFYFIDDIYVSGAEIDVNYNYNVLPDGLTVNFDGITNNNYTYHWDFGTGNPDDISTEEDPTFEFSEGGEYNVCLTVTYEPTGCKNRICKNIILKQPCSALYDIDLSYFTSDCKLAPILNIGGLTGDEMITYEWYAPFSNEVVSSQQNPIFNYDDPVQDRLCLRITVTDPITEEVICRDQICIRTEISCVEFCGDHIIKSLNPNPVRDYLNVTVDSKTGGSFQISDVYGVVLYKQSIGQITSTISIDMTGYRHGIYTLKLFNERNEFCKSLQILKN